MNEAAQEPPEGDGMDAPLSTSAQLKAAYDRGETGDKVAALDPAASPLGTDSEAAGTPPTAAEVVVAGRHEQRPAVAAGRSDDLVRNVSPRPGVKAGVLIGVIAALVLAALLALALR